MLARLLGEEGTVIEPVRDESCFTATFISGNDQRLVLYLYLMLLLLRLGSFFIGAIFLFLLLLLLLLMTTGGWMHLAFAHGYICLHKIVQVVEVGLVTIKLSNTKQVRITVWINLIKLWWEGSWKSPNQLIWIFLDTYCSLYSFI